MYLRKAVSFFAVALAVSGLTVFSGCGQKPSPKNGVPASPVATVNGNTIDKQDLKRELAQRAAQDPSFKITPQTLKEQLDLMVSRKILIQEAIDRKLAEQESFKTAIRGYWEQTLIRLLMDNLSQDFDKNSFATEAEIQSYYARLDSKVVFEIIRGKNRTLIEKAYEMALKKEPLEWDEKIGPVSYDELTSEILEEAYALKAGDYKLFEKGDLFYLVHLASKEPAAPPALDLIREKIKTKIKLRKQRVAFDQWLKERKKNADIKVSPDILNERSAHDILETSQK